MKSETKDWSKVRWQDLPGGWDAAEAKLIREDASLREHIHGLLDKAKVEDFSSQKEFCKFIGKWHSFLGDPCPCLMEPWEHLYEAITHNSMIIKRTRT